MPPRGPHHTSYADCPYCYWTGYFTSRPALKVRCWWPAVSACSWLTGARHACVCLFVQGYVRKAGAYLSATKQLDAMTMGNGTRWWQFAQDMGVVQVRRHTPLLV